MQGAGGDAPKPLLAKTGGNAFRTWGADNLQGQLDEAKANGLMLMAGFWLGHAEHGFNYTDAGALESTRRDVLAKVRAFKDHDALLCWALGSPEEMHIVGYEGTDNVGVMARMTDACLYLTYILLSATVLTMICGYCYTKLVK